MKSPRRESRIFRQPSFRNLSEVTQAYVVVSHKVLWCGCFAPLVCCVQGHYTVSSFEQCFPEGGLVGVRGAVSRPRDRLGGVQQAVDGKVVGVERGPDDWHDGVRSAVLRTRHEVARLAVLDEAPTEDRDQPAARPDAFQQRLQFESGREVVVVERATMWRQVLVEPPAHRAGVVVLGRTNVCKPEQ